ncbi:E3 Ubiquitin-Protein Ligase Rnf6 [Manis pentadactyla]|nr:E3 Ubiquitin-Protein Ligase Rnf6 [Manis pentadactyla]
MFPNRTDLTTLKRIKSVHYHKFYNAMCTYIVLERSQDDRFRPWPETELGGLCSRGSCKGTIPCKLGDMCGPDRGLIATRDRGEKSVSRRLHSESGASHAEPQVSQLSTPRTVPRDSRIPDARWPTSCAVGPLWRLPALPKGPFQQYGIAPDSSYR